jgi:dTDP-4-dehydrorhamnose reductase
MILVTGASGLLGSNLVLHLQKEGTETLAIYNKKPIFFENVQSMKLDITDEKSVKNLILSKQPECIIHCAAQTDVDWCENNPSQAYKINVDATRYIAESAYKTGSPVIFISTDSVFNGERGNYSETDVPDPLNIYAKSKLQGEAEVLKTNANNIIIRTNIYGWNLQKKYSLSEWILNKLESGQTVPAFHDIIFSSILVNDLSEIILKMANERMYGLYHVGSSESCTKYEFARKLAEVFNLDIHLVQPVSIADMNLNARRPKNMSLNTIKINSNHYIKTPDIISGLKKFKLLRESGYVQVLKKCAECV